MLRIYVSTVFRRENERGQEGRIYALDWATKELLWEIQTCGVRGLVFFNGILLIATFTNQIRSIDAEKGLFVKEWEYPELSFLHKIYVHDGQLFLPSTGNDKLGIVDSSMRIVELQDITPGDENTLHFNSMAWDSAGDEYHLYHIPGTIINRTRQEIIFEGFEGGHDLEFIDEVRLVTSHSSARKTLVGNVQTRELATLLEVPDGPSSTVSAWGWTRGIAYYNGGLLVGSAPVDIYQFETESFQQIDQFRLSDTVEESIFDICLDPRDWKGIE